MNMTPKKIMIIKIIKKENGGKTFTHAAAPMSNKDTKYYKGICFSGRGEIKLCYVPFKLVNGW